jgi:alkylation response protein AidB-like acyl-CoA dehydrogenase
MLLETSEEQEMLRDSARELALSLHAGHADFDRAWSAFSDMGMTGICGAVELGGVGMSVRDLGIVVNTVSSVQPGWGAALALHNLGGSCRLTTIDPAVDTVILKKILSGALQATAASPCIGDSRAYVHGGLPAERRVVSIKEGDRVRVMADTQEDGARFHALGWDGFSSAVLPETAPMMLELKVADCTEQRFQSEWLQVWADAALGVARGALNAMRQYVEERQQFGRPLSAFQAIQWMLADSSAEHDAAEVLLTRAYAAAEPEYRSSLAAARMAAAAAVGISDRAIQAHGGYGFTREYTVEGFWRSAHQIQKTMLPPLDKQVLALSQATGV